MLVGITGRKCAGKSTVHRLLVERFGFSATSLASVLTGTGSSDASVAIEAESGNKDGASTHWRAAASERCWRSDAFYILPPSLSRDHIYALKKRPYFLLLAVDAPTLVRFRRWQQRARASCNGREADQNNDLASFLREDDIEYFGLEKDGTEEERSCNDAAGSGERSVPRPPMAIWRCIEIADVCLHNNSECLEDLAKQIARLELNRPDWLRPAWDTYFMRIAELASMRTNCMKRRVGAVIVRDHRVIATGYNGTPRGTRNCNEGGCQRCNGGARAGHALEACLCLHAEENAIIEAGRERCAGATLFTNLCPCLSCTKKIVQAGIREVVYGAAYAMDARSSVLLAEADVRLRHYPCTWSRAKTHQDNLGTPIPLVSKDLDHLRLNR
ncbi:hypothetical protein F1559_004327 [Cyanidiococcus yangmingshanensis]|uniref:Deoxycytidylate deaminase n=1 Tax=Cyanidiococcus yangmingshanensis TaxID=2690220 RepID=A0A7J7IPJ2_9RHOD|nr:hypothetical protein F1559_004327 [Cyanidiococcus yangmingshanensis]